MKKTNNFLSIILILTMMVGLVTSTSAFATTAPYIKSDSPSSITLPKHNTYTFKFTVVGKINGTPTFSIGNGAILNASLVKKNGNDYYYKVSADGKVDTSTGVYSKIPGQVAVRQATVHITAEEVAGINPAGFVQLYFDENSYDEGYRLTGFEGSTRTYQLRSRDDVGTNAEVDVTNSNPDVLDLFLGSSTAPSTNIKTKVTKDGRDESYYFTTKAKKVGTATLQLTVKLNNGYTIKYTQYWTFVDPACIKIESDSPSSMEIKNGESYQFRFAIPQKVISYGITQGMRFISEAKMYSKDLKGQEVQSSITTNYDSTETNKGSGVYQIKLSTALTEEEKESGCYYKPGDYITVACSMSGLPVMVLCTLKIV